MARSAIVDMTAEDRPEPTSNTRARGASLAASRAGSTESTAARERRKNDASGKMKSVSAMMWKSSKKKKHLQKNHYHLTKEEGDPVVQQKDLRQNRRQRQNPAL